MSDEGETGATEQEGANGETNGGDSTVADAFRAALTAGTPAPAEEEAAPPAAEPAKVVLPKDWVALHRHKKAVAKREAELKASEAAGAARVAELEAKAARLDKLEKLRAEDPEAWEREVGLDYEAATNRRLRAGDPVEEAKKAAAAEVARLQAEEAAARKAAQEHAQSEHMAAVEQTFVNTFASAITENEEAFPALSAALEDAEDDEAGSARRVLLTRAKALDEKWRNSGKRDYLSTDLLKALDEQESLRQAKIAERHAARSAPLELPERTPGPKQTGKVVGRTLSNRQSAGTSRVVAPDYRDPQAVVSTIASALAAQRR